MNASDYCIGAVLCQNDDRGNEWVIQYLSHQLATPQRSWSTIVKKCYAIVYAIDKQRTYLQGAQFSVYTDHHPLTSLFTKQIFKNTKLIRWQVFLSELTPNIGLLSL